MYGNTIGVSIQLTLAEQANLNTLDTEVLPTWKRYLQPNPEAMEIIQRELLKQELIESLDDSIVLEITNYEEALNRLKRSILRKENPTEIKRIEAREYYHKHPEERKQYSKQRYQDKRDEILEKAKIRNPLDFQKNRTQILTRRIRRGGSKSINSHVVVSFEILNSLLVSKQQ